MAASRHQLPRAFTIVEILVVVVIIAILISILIPSLGAIRNKASRAATSARMGAIQTGLTQYYNDFESTYPPSAPVMTGIAANRGDQMLAEAMIGYLPGNQDGAGVSVGDSSEFGFRTRKVNPNMGGANGKVSGPYGPYDVKSFNGTTYIDAWQHPILYYRSTRAGTPDPTLPPVTLAFGTGTGASNNYYFNQADCSAVSIVTSSFTSNATPNSPVPPAGFFQLIGATGNAITGAVSGYNNYLMISAGPDEKYFTADDIIMTK